MPVCFSWRIESGLSNLYILFVVFSLFLSLKKTSSNKIKKFFKLYGIVLLITGFLSILGGFDGIVFSWVISILTISPMLGFLYLYKLLGFPYGIDYISWLDSGLFESMCIIIGLVLFRNSVKSNWRKS